MMCYKDQSFCNSDCTKKDCWRFITEEVNKQDRVCVSNFSGNCPDYTPPTDDTEGLTKDKTAV